MDELPSPAWFDPTRDVLLTPSRLRGLVHPVRVKLLRLLHDGPATATQLGARIGQSSGVTSYHLRVLAEHGFIVEDTGRGNGRDRWWRLAYRAVDFTFRSPGDPADGQTVELAEQALRALIDLYQQRMLSYVAGLAADRDRLAQRPWQFADWPLRLTEREAREFADQVNALAARYHRDPDDPAPRPGTVRAVFQFQLLPDGPVQPPGGELPSGGDAAPDPAEGAR